MKIKPGTSILFVILLLSFECSSQKLRIYLDRGTQKSGFKNEAGKVAIAADYDYVHNFSEGFAAVSKNGKCYFIDSSGKELNKMRYDDVQSFCGGLARIATGETGKRKYGFIDKTGKEVIPCKYDEAKEFVNGLAPVKMGEKWGFIDKEDKEAIKFQYDDAYEFWDELAAVNIGGKIPKENGWRAEGGTWGFIDKSGKIIIPFQFKHAWSFYKGLAAVEQDSGWFFIDKAGKQLCSKYFWNVGFGPFVRSSYNEDKIGFTPSVLQDEFPSFLTESNNLTIVTLFSRYDYIDIFKDGFATVRRNEKSGVINFSGKEVIEVKYDGFAIDRGIFNNGLACVWLDGKVGYLDTAGRVVIPFKYDFATPFNNKVALVNVGGTPDVIDRSWAKGGKWSLIDKTGKELTSVKYDNVGRMGFQEGLIAVNVGGKPSEFDFSSSEGGKWGFLNSKGKVTIPITFEWVGDFSEGLAPFSVTTEKADEYGQGAKSKIGFIDTKGKVVIAAKYDNVFDFSNGKATVWLGDEKILIDRKGNKVKTE